MEQTEETPDCDIKSCVVQVNDPDIPGFVDASRSGINYSDTPPDCKRALEQAGKTEAGFERAKAAIPDIIKAVGFNSPFVNLLAAIGIQETDFISRNQDGGGPGRGVYQIEPKSYGISESDANDLGKASVAVSTYLENEAILISHAMKGAGVDPREKRVDRWAGLARIHNRGPGGVVSVDKRGNPAMGLLLQQSIDSGMWGFKELDNKGQLYAKNLRQTENGTYVSNVMDLFWDCFGGFDQR